MNRTLVASVLTVSALAISRPGAAQDLATLNARAARVIRPEPGGILTPPSTAARVTVVANFLQSRGVDAETATSLRDGTARRDARTGLSHLQMRQEVGGLQVYGAYVKATFSERGELLHLIEQLARVSPAGVVRSRINAAQAVAAAFRELYPNQTFDPAEAGRSGDTTTFAAGAFFQRNPTVTAVALPMTDNVLRAGFLVESWSRAANQLHHTIVGGDGRVLFVEARTNQDKYNVFVEDPGKGAQTVVDGPGAGNAESPSGWLSGSQTTVNISGNNVHAYLDVNNNNSPDAGGTGVTTGEFLTASDLTSSPSTSDNRNVAVQNLFYLNNTMHDLLYRHGFDEAAGNFQTNNFGQGGAGNDAVNAEAQDGGGTDNANFATPADGSAPRMQMYLWTGKGDHLVLVNAATYLAAGASFGPALSTTGITGLLAVANDGSGTTSDACEAIPANQLTGKVAVVDRGTCDFTVKVRNAQAAGAVAVVVANNAGDSYLTMGGTDRRIKIPSVMVGQTDGAAIKQAAGASGTALKNPVTPLQRDGSVDFDVVAHEYCHGLTWRMIGGMSGALPGAIGEGMSDVCALLINGDDRIGEYSSSDPNGIRRNPYTNYPRTYKDVTGAEVHNDGEVYAAIGWRLKQNFEGAGKTVDELFADLVNGMNYTPSGPYFEDMRDGILSPLNQTDQCLVWDAFADFGVGVGASATVGRQRGKTVVTVAESTALPAACSAIP
jgi:extracellular elastinolytic metalloproteinase